MLEFIVALPVGAVIGWIIREIVSDRLARDRALETIKITEFNKAAVAFRISFINEIFLLRENILTGNKIPSEIIRPDILIAHEKAKITFEPFVPAPQRKAFNDAWEKYKNSENIYCQQTPPEKMGIKEFKPDLSKIYLDHINNLLEEFAKLKI